MHSSLTWLGPGLVQPPAAATLLAKRTKTATFAIFISAIVPCRRRGVLCACADLQHVHVYMLHKREKTKWDIGIREKAHKQDTSQTQQPHSTIITSAPTSPFQHKSRSTTTSHIQSMLLSQPLHSHPKQHSYSNKITIQIFNNNYDSVCMH